MIGLGSFNHWLVSEPFALLERILLVANETLEIPLDLLSSGDLHEHHEHSNNHKVVGISLLLGFVSMLLVDQCSGSHGHSHSPEINLGMFMPEHWSKSDNSVMLLI